MRHVYWFFWFMKESYSFMQGHSKVKITLQGIPKGVKCARDMVKWERMTPEQREAWYLSGEGRVMEF